MSTFTRCLKTCWTSSWKACSTPSFVLAEVSTSVLAPPQYCSAKARTASSGTTRFDLRSVLVPTSTTGHVNDPNRFTSWSQ